MKEILVQKVHTNAYSAHVHLLKVRKCAMFAIGHVSSLEMHTYAHEQVAYKILGPLPSFLIQHTLAFVSVPLHP